MTPGKESIVSVGSSATLDPLSLSLSNFFSTGGIGIFNRETQVMQPYAIWCVSDWGLVVVFFSPCDELCHPGRSE